MWWQVATASNAVISAAYFAISAAILVPLLRAEQLRTNRLGAATAAIFFSCAVGHGLHTLHPLLPLIGGRMAGSAAMMGVDWYDAVWDAITACVAVYYWTLHRTYGSLMRGATLFEDMKEQQRVTELEAAKAVADARADADRERNAHAAMLKSVIANSQSLIYVKDLEGRYLLANKTFEQVFGVTEQDLLGQTDAYLDPELAPVWRVNDLRAQQGSYELDEWSEAADGRHVYESVKFPLFDGHGTLYATCGISLDVTERRRITAALTAAHGVAVAAAASKATFLATMSHEIRTPMNAVIGMTGLLLDTELSAEQREFTETVRDSGDALLMIINDILDFSKIESGELELEAEPFDLRDAVENALAQVALPAADKGLELIAELDEPRPGLVVGDVTRFRQVIVNLLSNAVKFTETGEVAVTVTAQQLTQQLEGPVRIQVTVRDTGIGIPAEAIDRLFRSFSQVDSSTTRVYGGTGLGLAISRRLAQAMGGDLGVQSAPFQGSTFTFTGVLTGSSERRAPAGLPAGSLSGKSALVVDDNQTNRRMLQRLLTGWGMSCTDVATPAAAIELLTAGSSFEVALLDMDMPHMNGVQLASALGGLPTGRHLPLVLLSSLQWRPEAADRSLFAATLTKPARSSLLREKLLEALAPTEAMLQSLETAGGSREGDGSAVGQAPLRILYAEDNEVNQRVGQIMLGKLGYRVDTVADGSQALAAVRAQRYDVVLMDVQMPTMDGLQATRRIRAELPAGQQPRIVAITASVLIQDRQACTEAGMDDYLAKPVREQELRSALSRVRPAASGTAIPGPVRARPAPELAAGPMPLDGVADGPALDMAVLDALSRQLDDDDGMLRAALLSDYLDQSRPQVSELSQAARSFDVAGVARAAHALRASSATLGAMILAGLLLGAEQQARAGTGGLTAQAEGVSVEFERVAAAMRELLDQPTQVPADGCSAATRPA